MSVMREFISEKLSEYLERKSIPRGMEGNSRAIKAEFDALLSCLMRFAPSADYGDWWESMVRHLDENSKTRSWPLVEELKDAIFKTRPPKSIRVSQGDEIDPLQINAKRMNSGEPVGDQWLYGQLAHELENSGLVNAETFQKYRSSLFFSMKRVWHEETARKVEGERRQHHGMGPAR
jgi:hypothetical protein